MLEGLTISPFSRPMYIMAKPVGASCNLSCRYCYYLEKSGLYPDEPRHHMDENLLEDFIREYIRSQTTPQVLFIWHGGEPLLRPLSFYERVIELQKRYAGGRIIDNCIQTNGTLLTDEWCRFFKDHNWLVGVSIDGTRDMHDRFRLDRLGQPSFDKVMQGIALLDRHGVEWNAMAVVNSFNADHPLEFYRFFKSIGCRYIQFTPVVERSVTNGTSCLTDTSVKPEQWGNFLCVMFDEWSENDVGEYFIQIFESTLANWMGETPGLCTMARTCGHAGVIEHNGDVYSCDHFVFPQYRLGNIRSSTLVEMMYGPRQLEFGLMKQSTLPPRCRECEFLFACNGGCPKDRFAVTADGHPGLNYLCEGYRRFFRHSAPFMEKLREDLSLG